MTDTAATIAQAITTRHSVRAFLDQPVPRETIEHLLDLARYAPSGTNTQPWHVYALAGDVKQNLSAAILAELTENDERQEREYEYYPTDWYEPYLARRRACGWGLYGSLGIERGDKARMQAQPARNYIFFDAPVGLLFSIERRLNTGRKPATRLHPENLRAAPKTRPGNPHEFGPRQHAQPTPPVPGPIRSRSVGLSEAKPTYRRACSASLRSVRPTQLVPSAFEQSRRCTTR